MKQAIRPAIFKWRQTEPALILCAVRWYLRYSLSFRDVEELLRERGLEADHTTIWRWVQRLLQNQQIAAVPHGFRSTFRDWAAEETNHPREVIEAALAHMVQNQVEAGSLHHDLRMEQPGKPIN